MTDTRHEMLCLPAAEIGRLAGELLREGRTVRVMVGGDSMRPTLQPGDIVSIEPLSVEPRLGDVVLCTHENTCWLHRVIWKGKGGVVRTQGDALRSLDPPVTRAEMVGRVVRIERKHDDGRIVVVEQDSARARIVNRAIAVQSLMRCIWGGVSKRIKFLQASSDTSRAP